MKYKNYLYLFLLFLFGAEAVFAQEVDDYIYKIDLKLRKDKNYLNLFYLDVPGNEAFIRGLGTIPRQDGRDPFSFKNSEAVNYRFVFIKDAIGLDSLIVLYVTELVTAGADTNALFAEGTGEVTDNVVIPFKDMYYLKVTAPDTYAKIFEHIDRQQRIDPEFKYGTLLGIVPDDEIKTSLGITSRDNTDFLNYMRANYNHWYPREAPKVAGRRGGGETATQSFAYRLDAGFSSVSFAHRFMDFSLGGASIELGTEEPVLNVLPYQANILNFGFRTLISVADKKTDLYNALIIDARFMGRVAMNTTSIADNLPFILGGGSRVNVGTSAAVDLHLTRPFGMPFLNLYVSVGSPGYSSPSVRFNDPKIANTEYAYWSFTQAEATMSFYWNTSDKKTVRMKADVGVGHYDMRKAYYNKGASAQKANESVKNLVSPVVAFSLTFVPDGVNELFGGKVRIFDSSVKAESWLKLLEFPGGHTIRFAATVVSGPLGRSRDDWESEGGAMVQLRYRYGF